MVFSLGLILVIVFRLLVIFFGLVSKIFLSDVEWDEDLLVSLVVMWVSFEGLVGVFFVVVWV